MAHHAKVLCACEVSPLRFWLYGSFIAEFIYLFKYKLAADHEVFTISVPYMIPELIL